MRPIPFSGMMCNPKDIQKEGDFKIKGIVNIERPDTPPIIRYEHFPSTAERDIRYNLLTKLLKETP
jgi:hypothetical protein